METPDCDGKPYSKRSSQPTYKEWKHEITAVAIRNQAGSQPTYKEWKRVTLMVLPEDESNVPSLPTRNGNLYGPGEPAAKVQVPSLPTRNGNYFPASRLNSSSLRSQPTYKEWKRSV